MTEQAKKEQLAKLASEVTVVIPAYKAESTIERAIRSVLNQTIKPCEILVVDDGSPDASFDIASRFGSPVRVLKKPNGGSSSARNFGIENASSEWIAFLDSDDTWKPQRLERQLQILKHHPELAWLSGRYQVTYPDGRVAKSKMGDPLPDMNTPVYPDALPLLANGCRIWTGTMLIRRSVLMDLNGFDERQKTSHDSDLWFRIAVAHPEMGFAREVIAEYHVGNAASLTRRAVIEGDKTWIHSIETYMQGLERVSDMRRADVHRFATFKTNQAIRNALRGCNSEHARWIYRESTLRGVTGVLPALRIMKFMPAILLRFTRMVKQRIRSRSGGADV